MYLVREQNNDLILFVGDEKPFKHHGSWKTRQQSQTVMLDNTLHPEVQWIDSQPTECRLQTIGHEEVDVPKYDLFSIRHNQQVECQKMQGEPLIGGFYCRNCENNLQTCNDESGNIIVKCIKHETDELRNG